MKGSWPVSISCKTQPRAYRSAGGPTALARACSGAMYGGVPTVCPVMVSLSQLPGAQQRGDPEVEYLDDAARGEEQVAWLDVAVHDREPVHFAEHRGDLRGDRGCPGERRGRAVVVVLGDQVSQLCAREQLHDQVQVARGFVGSCVVDGRNAGVRQGGGGLHLTQEPQPGVLRRLGLLGTQRLGRTAGCSSRRGTWGGFISFTAMRRSAGCRSLPTPRPCLPARSGGQGGTCL